MMKTQTLVVSEFLTLRPFTEDMVTPAYVAWLSNPRVVKFSEQRHRTHTIDTCREFVASIDHETSHMWALIYQGRHIGNITAHRDIPNKTADIGILIGDPDVWGMGLGLGAWRAVMTWLLNNGCRKITAGTMAENLAMLQVFRNADMEIDGRRKGYFLLDGLPVDMVFASTK